MDKKEVEELGTAEKFLYYCTQIPDYSLRVEVMKSKKDLKASIDGFNADFKSVINHCNTIVKSETFKSFLQFVLQVGNILNEVTKN